MGDALKASLTSSLRTGLRGRGSGTALVPRISVSFKSKDVKVTPSQLTVLDDVEVAEPPPGPNRAQRRALARRKPLKAKPQKKRRKKRKKR